MDLNKGGWANKESCAPAMGVQDETPKLSDMGISFNQSSRWQAMAKLPEEVFEKIRADVFSWNFYRKHYTIGQKAVILGKRSVLESGRPKSIASIDAIKPTIPELAREGGISAIKKCCPWMPTRLPGRYVLWP